MLNTTIFRIGLFIFSSILATSVLVAESPKIAVVDLQRVLEESIAGKASKANLDKNMKETKAKLEIEKIKLEQMAQELKKQKSLLSKDAWNNRQLAFQKAERDFQKMANDAQQDMQRKTAQTIQKIMEQVTMISAELAKQQGYNFVIEQDVRFVIYAEETVNLSKQVIAALDKKKMQF